ncbi:40S ribosomal S10-like protein, putative [Medicago truncatula]|uniref:40S ribosomal S10-like protein, putative n=1 Tax=Medicago truncatula TaxID=3880 RepID=G7KGV8_MEDTR|nr:40S ribosomal S10-like protein, putative [Medicago truncatula]
MDNLFGAQIRFNAGNPYLFKVRDDVTLKDLNDQLNEINPGDTRRVDNVQYAHPGLI